MSRIGFCGPSYKSTNVAADAQMCMNLFLEQNESGAGKSSFNLLQTPGTSQFANLADTPFRRNGLIRVPGIAVDVDRVFAVSGATLYEVSSVGVGTSVGAVGNDGLPVSMAASASQLMIASAGQGYCLNLTTGVFTGPIANIAGVIQFGYSDGYFVALVQNSQTIQLSALLDGTSWDLTQKAIVSVFPGKVKGMIVDHREICLLGDSQSVCYYDSGNTFPYDVVPSGFMEQGSASAFGKAKADNSYFWWGQDARGSGIAWRAQGYTPVRVSTHAIEAAIASYSTISDAVSYSYQQGGHTFWVTYFPSANKTWALDLATGQWHERGFWNTTSGTHDAHRSNAYCYAFGKHLIGDYQSGNIGQLDQTIQTDWSGIFRWVRRAPYISEEGVWMFLHSIEIEAEAGLGAAGTNPLVMLKVSKDRAKTFGGERQLSVGKVGEYAKRIIGRRFGKFWGTSGAVIELSGSDPVPVRIVDVYVNASPNMGASERIASKLRAQA